MPPPPPPAVPFLAGLKPSSYGGSETVDTGSYPVSSSALFSYVSVPCYTIECMSDNIAACNVSLQLWSSHNTLHYRAS